MRRQEAPSGGRNPSGRWIAVKPDPPDHFLLLDNLHIEIGSERPRDRVGDVNSFEEVAVVPGHSELTAEVPVVHARAGSRVARGLGIVGQDARHDLQVALIGTAGRHRLGKTQPQRLARDRGCHVQ